MPLINFFEEDISYTLKDKIKLRKWFEETIHQEKKFCGEINYILCSDKHLHTINVDYLSHDDYTDVITFDYTEGGTVSGDIFISLERIKENARDRKLPITKELHRVMVHGLLHLLGYKDKSSSHKLEMTSKEDYYLNLQSF